VLWQAGGVRCDAMQLLPAVRPQVASAPMSHAPALSLHRRRAERKREIDALVFSINASALCFSFAIFTSESSHLWHCSAQSGQQQLLLLKINRFFHKPFKKTQNGRHLGNIANFFAWVWFFEFDHQKC
jgi:hypothetical protein